MLPHFRRIIRSQDIFADAFKARNIAKKKIVLDFSSPNIAKTFHIGNLRSTLYGNFICKLYRSAGHDVHSINYVGDWGTQFSLLAVYWELARDIRPSQFQWDQWNARERVEFLTQFYADAYRHVKSNDHLLKRASEIFSLMEATMMRDQRLSAHIEVERLAASESGPSFPTSAFLDVSDEESSRRLADALELWRRCRDCSAEYLTDFYRRFDVAHDEWNYESDYVHAAHGLVDRLVESGVAFHTQDKMWAVHEKYIGGKVVLRKSDNSSLYLSRDLAALFDRVERFQADEYAYVVDRSQYRHFAHLKSILVSMECDDLAPKIRHVPYGRVIGLSTRQGKNDSVDFLIAQGVAEASHHVGESPTTRIDPNAPDAIDIYRRLSKSVLVFDIMRRHRATEYTFSFKGAFKLDNNNALFLNEKYSRLCSMEKVNHELMARVAELTASESASFGRLSLELSAPAQNLARMLYELDTCLMSAYEQLEPCVLVNYLLKLSHQIGSSMHALRVRGEVEQKALPRLMLFVAAKRVLADGMRVLGIEPVDSI